MTSHDRRRQLAFDLPHRPQFSRSDFLSAEANAAALAALDALGDSGGEMLVVSGPAGCGKTHLAHIWASRTRARWITPEALDDALPELAALPPTAIAFDDADRFVRAGREAEAALFHLINVTRQQGGALLLTGRDAPSRWQAALPDLHSRLAALQTAAIGAPDDALLGAVLVKLFADRQTVPGEEVVAYLLPRMDRSLAFARELVGAIDREALGSHRPVTVPLAARVLTGLQETSRTGEGA